MINFIRLCVESGLPICPCNEPGPTHCLAHQESKNCATAIYDRREGTLDTEADRNAETQGWAKRSSG